MNRPSNLSLKQYDNGKWVDVLPIENSILGNEDKETLTHIPTVDAAIEYIHNKIYNDLQG